MFIAPLNDSVSMLSTNILITSKQHQTKPPSNPHQLILQSILTDHQLPEQFNHLQPTSTKSPTSREIQPHQTVQHATLVRLAFKFTPLQQPSTRHQQTISIFTPSLPHTYALPFPSLQTNKQPVFDTFITCGFHIYNHYTHYSKHLHPFHVTPTISILILYHSIPFYIQ